MSDIHFIGIDVGTGSARAGVFDAGGRLLGAAKHDIALFQEPGAIAEQSSEDIWSAVCRAVKGARDEAGIAPADVAAIGFDATCSLVVRGADGRPLSVAESGESGWDTIAWLDHRAIEEAEELSRIGGESVRHSGGTISPEMQLPKLMWLKRHLPQSWARAAMMFDLADFLSWKATGSLARSQSTLTCKWTYLGHSEQKWRQDFLTQVGLDDLIDKAALPQTASPVGADLGRLTQAAADDLGLTTACHVGAGLIDAHAGALGVLGAFTADVDTIDRHLALIAGTSSCVMALSAEDRPTTGVWGPYFGAVLPGVWLNEGGQSATGALLDHVIRWHGAGGEPTREKHLAICQRVMELRETEGIALADRLHVLPDFHGNRSPLGDPFALGVISGLTLDSDFDSLCRLYWRTCVSIALGVRHILETLNTRGYSIDTLHITGGHTRNPLLMELYADATFCTVVEPSTPDATLLGMAMVAANAAGLYPTLDQACLAMQQGGTSRAPDPAARAQFDRDYRIFLEMIRQRQLIDRLE